MSTWLPPALESLKSEQFPNELLRTFCMELGGISTRLGVLENALTHYAHKLETEPRPVDTVIRDAKKIGRRLFISDAIDVSGARHLVALAEIALLLSRFERFCRAIRTHPCVNQQIAWPERRLDMLRKTVWSIDQSQRPLKKDFDESLTSALRIDNQAKALYDYYRLARNGAMHDSDRSLLNQHTTTLASAGSTGWDSYGASPSSPEQFRFNDVLAFSKSLQSIARSLVASLLDRDRTIIPWLRLRFSGKTVERRIRGATAFLEQRCCIDSFETTSIVQAAWAA